MPEYSFAQGIGLQLLCSWSGPIQGKLLDMQSRWRSWKPVPQSWVQLLQSDHWAQIPVIIGREFNDVVYTILGKYKNVNIIIFYFLRFKSNKIISYNIISFLFPLPLNKFWSIRNIFNQYPFQTSKMLQQALKFVFAKLYTKTTSQNIHC